MQFVVLTNMATALEYLPKTVDSEKILIDSYPIHSVSIPTNETMLVDVTNNPLGISLELIDSSFGETESCIDLCLPLGLISEFILPSHLKGCSCSQPLFPSITWFQPKLARPPILLH
jgi:hypothetical protein